MGHAILEAEVVLEYGLLASVLECVCILVGKVISELGNLVGSLDDDIPTLCIEHSTAHHSPGSTLIQAALGSGWNRQRCGCGPEVLLHLVPAFLLSGKGVVLGNGGNVLVDNHFLVALDKLEVHPAAEELELAFETGLILIGHGAVKLEVLESLVGAAYGCIESAPVAHVAVYIGWGEGTSAVSHLGRDVAEGVVVV